jgi:hypothetical protein
MKPQHLVVIAAVFFFFLGLIDVQASDEEGGSCTSESSLDCSGLCDNYGMHRALTKVKDCYNKKGPEKCCLYNCPTSKLQEACDAIFPSHCVVTAAYYIMDVRHDVVISNPYREP